jgi:hypothetical protein
MEVKLEQLMNKHNLEFLSSGRRITSLSAVLVASGALIFASQSFATTLVDSGSTATVDFNSSAGMSSWTVDGQNQLNQQWFWYRVGSSGVAMPINSISTAAVVTSGANGVTATYQNTDFALTIDYSLVGGGVGSGYADITEDISVTKLVNDGNPLDFHLFQYSDFNLLDTPGGQSVTLFPGGLSGFNDAIQTKGATQIAETITSPNANHGEAGLTSDSPNTLYRLNNVSGLILNDHDTAGVGDATWALQWDTSINYGQPFYIIKDKQLSIQMIPEPGTLALLALGLGAWMLGGPRRSV